MQHRLRADRPDRRHFCRRGHVEGADPRRDKVREHLGPVIGLDGIGHEPVEIRLKAPRRGLQHRRSEEQHRRVGAVFRQIGGGAVGKGGDMLHGGLLFAFLQ